MFGLVRGFKMLSWLSFFLIKWVLNGWESAVRTNSILKFNSQCLRLALLSPLCLRLESKSNRDRNSWPPPFSHFKGMEVYKRIFLLKYGIYYSKQKVIKPGSWNLRRNFGQASWWVGEEMSGMPRIVLQRNRRREFEFWTLSFFAVSVPVHFFGK